DRQQAVESFFHGNLEHSILNLREGTAGEAGEDRTNVVPRRFVQQRQSIGGPSTVISPRRAFQHWNGGRVAHSEPNRTEIQTTRFKTPANRRHILSPRDR